MVLREVYCGGVLPVFRAGFASLTRLPRQLTACYGWAMRPTSEVLEEIGLLAFQPATLLRTGLLQTLAGAYWPQPRETPPTEVHKIDLGKQDETTIAVDRPADWQSGDRVVLLVHGLAGSIHSTYMTRLARLLPARGCLTVRMNLRNCGSAFGLSRRTYHAGLTADARVMLSWMAEKFPGSPVTAVGFSLGGNLLLKMATEDGPKPTAPLDSLAAISPATDLARSSAKLARAPGKWIAQVFIRELVRDVEKLKEIYPELPSLMHLRGRTMREFDNEVVAKLNMFSSAEDYYAKCSSLPDLAKIKVPTLILGAFDDPVVEFAGLRDAKLPAHIDVILTKTGGHVGFVGQPWAEGGARWADTALIKWMTKRL